MNQGCLYWKIPPPPRGQGISADVIWRKKYEKGEEKKKKQEIKIRKKEDKGEIVVKRRGKGSPFPKKFNFQYFTYILGCTSQDIAESCRTALFLILI
jgi:hypothetical protein